MSEPPQVDPSQVGPTPSTSSATEGDADTDASRRRAVIFLLVVPVSLTTLFVSIFFGDFGNRLIAIVSAAFAFLFGIAQFVKPSKLLNGFRKLATLSKIGLAVLSILLCLGVVVGGLQLSAKPPPAPILATQRVELTDGKDPSVDINPKKTLQLNITDIAPPSSRVVVRVSLVDVASNNDCLREMKLTARPQFASLAGSEGQAKEVVMGPIEPNGQGRPYRLSAPIEINVPGRLSSLSIGFSLSYYSACDLQLNVIEVTSSVPV